MKTFLTIILSAAPDVRNKTLSLQGKQDSTPLSDLFDPSLENQKMKHRTSIHKKIHGNYQVHEENKRKELRELKLKSTEQNSRET